MVDGKMVDRASEREVPARVKSARKRHASWPRVSSAPAGGQNTIVPKKSRVRTSI